MSYLGHKLRAVVKKFAEFFYYIFKSVSVARAVTLSFGIAILFGTILLFLVEKDLDIFDSFYLSASAFCVTGLTTKNISELSLVGQILIMLYIQIGGLGIIVFTVFVGLMVLSGLSRNAKLRDFVKEVLDTEVKTETGKVVGESDRIWRVIFSILKITFFLESLGAIALYFVLPPELPYNVSRVFLAIFTSISAFNNAGFSLVNDLSFLIKSPIALYILSILIVLGGIGYPVIIFIEKTILEIIHKLVSYFEVRGETYLMTQAIRGEEPSRLYFLLTRISAWSEYRIEDYNKRLFGESNIIQTKIIFYWTIALLFGGCFLLLSLEFNNPLTISNLSFHEKFANILFLSASSRTAGFNTFLISNLYDASIVLLCILMFIGGGPQGTAGGIKITTFAILIKYLENVISSLSNVRFFDQTISKKSVAMSIRLYFLGTTVIAVIIFLLTLIRAESGQLQNIVFEVISAFSTVGFSLGLSSKLSNTEKIIYSLVMYVGRIGVFNVLIAITGNPVTSQIGQEDMDVKIQVG